MSDENRKIITIERKHPLDDGNYRTEYDTFGEILVPMRALWGAQVRSNYILNEIVLFSSFSFFMTTVDRFQKMALKYDSSPLIIISKEKVEF